MQLVDQIILNPEESEVYSSVIDNINSYAYFIIGSWNGIIIKVDLTTFTRVATLTIGPGTGFLTVSTIDEEKGYLYVIGTFGPTPDLLHRIRLSDFQLDATLTLTRSSIIPILIDKINQKLYVSDASNHPRLTKIDLNTFTIENELIINDVPPFEMIYYPWSAAIDLPHQLLYLGSSDDPGKIAKFDLNSFTKISVLPLNSNDVYLEQAIFDQINQFLYIGTNNLLRLPCKITKIDANTLTVVDSLTLEPESQWITTYQPQNIINNFGFIIIQWVSPYRITKFSTNPFDLTESFVITGGDDYPQNIIFDNNGFAYIGTHSIGSPARIIKIFDQDLGQILTSIEVRPSSANVQIGSTKQFEAICRDQNYIEMSCPTIVWNVTDPTKGNISDTGLFTPSNEGITTITATFGSIVGIASINITSIPTTQATISPLGLGLLFGFLFIRKKCEDYDSKKECEKNDCKWIEGKLVDGKSTKGKCISNS